MLINSANSNDDNMSIRDRGILVIVAAVSLLSYKLYDPRSRALRCYARRRRLHPLFWMMSACLTLLGTALMVNASAIVRAVIFAQMSM